MIKNFFIEKPFKKWKNKAYCIQFSLLKLFLSTNFRFLFNLFNYHNWIIIHFNLFNLFQFLLNWNKKTDHCGFTLDITFLIFYFHFNIYDCRHWDYDNEKFI